MSRLGSKEMFWDLLFLYSEMYRERIDPEYRVFPGLLDAQDEYEAVVKTANLLCRKNIDVREYLLAQFEKGCPRITDLNTKDAMEKWRNFRYANNVEDEVNLQQTYRKFYEKSLGETVDFLVCIPTLPFSPWYRLVHMDTPDVDTAAEALSELANPILVSVLEKKGYNVNEIIDKGRGVVDGIWT